MNPVTKTTDGPGLARQWAGAAVAVGGFLLTDLSPVPEPPLLHPGHLVAWWGVHPPVVAAMSLLRVGGLVCGGYWLFLCSMVIVFTRSGHLLRLARLRLPGMGHLMKVATGSSLLGVAVVCATGCATTAGHPSAAAPRPPELVPLDNPTASATPPRITVRRLQAAPATSTPARGEPATRQPDLPPPTASPQAAPPPVLPTTTTTSTAATSWTVRPGEDLWSITESVLIARLGHAPDQREVAALWIRVIDTNRPDLPDPANPNLIFAGDVVVIPA